MKQIKKIGFGILAVVAIAAVSCSKYNNGIEDASIYRNIYMPRAANDSTVLTVRPGDSVYRLGYSAYIGGIENAQTDIKVSFEVATAAAADFNARSGTSYPLLPATNYTLSSQTAIIKAGERSTDSLTLSVKSDNNLSLFKTYILPVGIKATEGEGQVLKKYAVTFYLVRVALPPVLKLGSSWGGIFSLGPKNTIISNDKNSLDILMNLPKNDGDYNQAALHIGIRWDASESFYYLNENAMVVRNAPYWAGLFRFDMHPENILQNNPKPAENIITGIADWNTFWLGDFWNKYLIVPFRNYMITADNGGVLWRQPLFAKIDQNRTQVGAGFNYSQGVAYPSVNSNALLFVNAAGELWYYPVSETGVPGTGKKIGTGWNVFRKIIVSGNDILALDGSGSVYRLAFDPEKNYSF
ncbi:DUF1735 domain-containing protein [Niabella hirudinis]|uniref:DUF1735 domain-containing protein n=1 Tax=Niabella hirudinis TaxID=1285929 RepID=UPI003EB8BC4B